MRLPSVVLFAAAALAIAAPAAAEVSDQDFIQAHRCMALARSSKLEGGDPQVFKAFVEAERQGRTITTRRKADMAASLAKQEALAATGETKAALQAELLGACQAFRTQVATTQ